MRSLPSLFYDLISHLPDPPLNLPDHMPRLGHAGALGLFEHVLDQGAE